MGTAEPGTVLVPTTTMVPPSFKSSYAFSQVFTHSPGARPELPSLPASPRYTTSDDAAMAAGRVNTNNASARRPHTNRFLMPFLSFTSFAAPLPSGADKHFLRQCRRNRKGPLSARRFPRRFDNHILPHPAPESKPFAQKTLPFRAFLSKRPRPAGRGPFQTQKINNSFSE